MVAISPTVDQHVAQPLCDLSTWLADKHRTATHYIEEQVRDYSTQQVADYATYTFQALPYVAFFLWTPTTLVLGATCTVLWLKVVKPDWFNDELGTDVVTGLQYSQMFLCGWQLLQCIWNPASGLLMQSAVHGVAAKLLYDSLHN